MHFSEEWNELHHLLIMESMGGNKKWGDKFLAQHSAFAYFWFIAGCYMFNPTLAYNFNQVVEEHAYHTYDEVSYRYIYMVSFFELKINSYDLCFIV